MNFILRYMLLAVCFGLGLGLAQQGTIQCRCKATLTTSVIRTGGRKLCSQRGGILSADEELCTKLPKRFTDADCKTLGDPFLASCGSARSELKRGIYKREVVPLSTRPIARRLSNF